MPKASSKSKVITVDDYYSERFLRIEEELKHQRELMKIGFDMMEKRFASNDKRFESIDKRFDAIDRRFETMEKRMDDRFDSLTRRIDRFMIWSFGITLTCTGLIIAAMKIWK